MKTIDNDFFTNYASTGKPYNEVWRSYTGFDIFKEYTSQIKNLNYCLVLGSATGEILKSIHKECLLAPTGIELNMSAFDQSSGLGYDVFHGDMREIITSLPYSYDIIYSNSLMYLPENDIIPFLQECAKVGQYFFWYGSMEGFSVPDDYRVTLKNYDWWNEQFKAAGYKETTHRYLWHTL